MNEDSRNGSKPSRGNDRPMSGATSAGIPAERIITMRGHAIAVSAGAGVLSAAILLSLALLGVVLPLAVIAAGAGLFGAVIGFVAG